MKEEEESIEIISNPQKKVKPNETVQPTMTSTRNQMGGLPFSNPYLEQASLINPHRLPDSNNYNFNINMNLYLNQMPMPSMPSFMGGPTYNPYLDLQYQNMLYAQMSHLPMIPSFCQYQPQQPQYQTEAMEQGRQRPITYIVIDE